ncbi:type II secretion system protein N [Legionella spiritensis]|uniref:General secretion pathway protein C n=1 Tax=Legionella spiritensis TaxID=452 RepID=A0A0W0Z2L1_LEGSP|nr:type II secretion system protein N [Legionella spiritensis]KTD63361.1 general secretion pathway protein C [Legionella spiritensis]SNV35347.1 general secretion pathway protein C [Legionella spiritensis]VEG89744.1 general secretion pathway protein C [Legionella spiritensis]
MKIDFLSFWSPKEYDKKIAVAVFFIFLVLFLWQMLDIFQAVETDTPSNTPTRVEQAGISVKSPLFTASLFGEYIPVNLNDGDIKQSMLDAEIVGIMYSSQEKNSQVLIRIGGGEEKTYVVGDKLPGGAIIKRISPDSVVVLHNGSLESLSLPKIKLRFEEPAKPLFKE